MKLLKLVTAASVALLPAYTTAARAYVRNRCNFPIYVKSGNSVTTLAANTGTYSENLAGQGRVVFSSKNPQVTQPIQFDYTVSGGLTYYDLSTNQGNPFLAQGYSLIPQDPNCHSINCGLNVPSCAGTFYPGGPSNAVWACQQNSDLTFYPCRPT